jgi:4-hydroxythreonine-4-phosphate dehydrogenase
MKAKENLLLVSTGEPAGIGPEVSLKAVLALQQDVDFSTFPVLLGDIHLMRECALLLGIQVDFWQVDTNDSLSMERGRKYFTERFESHETRRIAVHHVPLRKVNCWGSLAKENAKYVLDILDQATLCALRDPLHRAVVTAPVHKQIIHEAGFPFSGHTEYFAQRAGCQKVVMMLVCEQMRVALATTHIPLNQVSETLAKIGVEGLLEIIQIIQTDLQTFFGIAHPKILMAGLNPHAGEGGVLGKEEQMILEPAIALAREEGIDVIGPLPADTLFQPKYLEDCDVVLSMFHDQGLPVLKYASFGQGVNVTLGLPFIRTSVDHGTALDLAAGGKANAGSMLAATKLAQQLLSSQL